MAKFKQFFKYQVAFIATGILLINHSLVFAAPIQLSLEEGIHIALQNNPAIRTADVDNERSISSLDETKAGKLPTVSLGSSYSMKGNNLDFSGDSSDVSNSLRANWQLYSGGRIEGQIKQAELGVTTAQIGIEKAKQQVKLDTTIGFYNVLQTGNMVHVNQETVDSLKQHLNMVQAKYEAGVVAKSDVLRAEVETTNAEQNLIKAQNSQKIAISALLNTMNMDADTELQLDGQLQYVPNTRTLDECIELAKSNQPDIVQAKNNITIADNGVKVAESGKRPSVSLSASTGWNNSFLPDNQNWNVGLSAHWNVFDAGVTNAKIKQAELALQKVTIQAEQTGDSVDQEVRQSYLNMREAEKRLENSQITVDKANEDLYIAQEKYNAGVGTNLDVLDAELALTQTKTNHVQALYDYNVNEAKLNKAIGVKVE